MTLLRSLWQVQCVCSDSTRSKQRLLRQVQIGPHRDVPPKVRTSCMQRSLMHSFQPGRAAQHVNPAMDTLLTPSHGVPIATRLSSEAVYQVCGRREVATIWTRLHV